MNSIAFFESRRLRASAISRCSLCEQGTVPGDSNSAIIKDVREISSFRKSLKTLFPASTDK